MNRAELHRLAEERLLEARALLAAKRWSGAYYLAGYAVECGLKACVVVRLKGSEDFPERKFSEQCWTHNLEQLVTVAGLKAQLNADIASDAELLDNWDVVKGWNEARRYEFIPRDRAENLYEAIADKKHGMLRW